MHEEPSLPQWWARGAALTPGVGAAPRTWPWGRRGHTFVTAGRWFPSALPPPPSCIFFHPVLFSLRYRQLQGTKDATP